MTKQKHSEFIQKAIDANYVEAKIVRKVVRALKKADNPITAVWDGETETKVSTEFEVMELVFNLDQAHLYAKSGAWVFLVNGNEWDMLSDYNTSLEEALKPVNDWIQKHY